MTSPLGLDKLALIDKSNKLLKIVDISEKLDNDDKEKADRFVILRDGQVFPRSQSCNARGYRGSQTCG